MRPEGGAAWGLTEVPSQRHRRPSVSSSLSPTIPLVTAYPRSPRQGVGVTEGLGK